MKRSLVSGLLLLLVAGFASSCVKARITGTYDGEWSDGTNDEITIEGDGAGLIILECDDCILQDEVEGEIDGRGEFSLDDSNVEIQIQNQRGKVDIEGTGEVRRGELELEVEVITSSDSAEVTFEGDKE